MAPDDAAVLVLVAEDWLELIARQAPGARSSPRLHAALSALAELAPEEAAANAPRLLALLGASVAYRVKVQAAAAHVCQEDAAAADAASWLTPDEAARVLGVTPHQVRWLARRGRLAGHRTELGWRVSAAAVRERLRSAAA